MIEQAGTAMTAASSSASTFAIFGAVISCAVIIIGAAYGIGSIGSRAVESIARQPEAGGRIFNSMVIAAALIEGVTFFALVICMLTVVWLR